MIKEGMIVRYASKWCRPEERKYLFVVLEAFEDVQRCLISCLNSKCSLGYQERVEFEMIEPTGFTVEELNDDLFQKIQDLPRWE